MEGYSRSICRLVEDDPQLRQLGWSPLAQGGYKVLLASNPEEGLWFLSKPFTLSALVAKVREVLDASSSKAVESQRTG
jgi:DNA-binding response OmpR family regulator